MADPYAQIAPSPASADFLRKTNLAGSKVDISPNTFVLNGSEELRLSLPSYIADREILCQSPVPCKVELKTYCNDILSAPRPDTKTSLIDTGCQALGASHFLKRDHLLPIGFGGRCILRLILEDILAFIQNKDSSLTTLFNPEQIDPLRSALSSFYGDKKLEGMARLYNSTWCLDCWKKEFPEDAQK